MMNYLFLRIKKYAVGTQTNGLNELQSSLKGHVRIIPAKFGQNLESSLGDVL